MKYVFITNGSFGTGILKRMIINNFLPSFVVTGNDVVKGRERKLVKPEAVNICNDYNIPYLQTDNINRDIEKIDKYDVAILCDFGQILKKRVLEYFSYGIVNIHPSLLPLYRGAAPIRRCIMDRQEESGITWMKMVRKLDAGPIIYQEKIKIDKCITYGDLFDRFIELSDITPIIMERYLNDEFMLSNQDESLATYAKKIEKDELKIDWSKTTSEIVGKVNALSPSPGAWTLLNGKRIKILHACEGECNLKIEPGMGKVINKQLYVGTSDGCIEVFKVQLEGKKPIDSLSFINGLKKSEFVLE